MMSLFSSFDLGFFSLSLLVLTMLMANIFNFSFKMSMMKKMISIIKLTLENFFMSLKKDMFKMTNTLFMVLFMMILTINFSSILSYNFAFTSQLSVTMFISLSLWTMAMSFKLMFTMKGFLSHCIPEGTPMYLTWFLFLIEVVSNSIRPLTATVRLVANVTAGHILMILLANLVFLYPMTGPAYLVLNAVEIAVAMIQAYIFTTMVCLYMSEIE